MGCRRGNHAQGIARLPTALPFLFFIVLILLVLRANPTSPYLNFLNVPVVMTVIIENKQISAALATKWGTAGRITYNELKGWQVTITCHPF